MNTSGPTCCRWRLALGMCVVLAIATSVVAAPAAGRMVEIPAGSFEMGDVHGVGGADERPVHTVFVSAFLMDSLEVSNGEMCRVMQWAYSRGLVNPTAATVSNAEGVAHELLDLDDWNSEIAFVDGVFTVATDRVAHPCVEVTWYGALAYGNYLSDMAGFRRAINFNNWQCDFRSTGYRLPTEAEWEKAARGGLDHQYFPWRSPDGRYHEYLTDRHANYWMSGDSFEGEIRTAIRTTPAGYYQKRHQPDGLDMANGYGLYDMAGNVAEWCWDYYHPEWYAQKAASLPDPMGPAMGSTRVFRGGSWLAGQKEADADRHQRSAGYYLRCANRFQFDPENGRWDRGFRCVRRP
ncbi:MAG: SUMF1/EgtB/PvdO family nonheme iron enzyme [Verrucomicrobia bacterium]|nr:SUMF1/EgtB/PvdO family nonheme iron enzyme [Verrucomicrobiota bacterium]